MSIVTTYICDRCKKEQKTPDQMWDIGVEVGHVRDPRDYGKMVYQKQMWCRECVDSFQLLGNRIRADEEARNKKSAEVAEQAKPTLEDMVRELAREEAADVVTHGSIL